MTSVAASAPPLDQSLVRRIRSVVGAEGLFIDPDQLLVYESDALTQYRHPPSAVVLPRTTEEVSLVLALLHAEGRAFVPRGAGTGLSGGALAVGGSVLVGTARMNRILELDSENRRARVQPGVVNSDLTRAALLQGLIYAPDPSSQSACTMGGNVAENSGGPHCLKYGVTNRYVTGLTVVLPDGEVVELGGLEREPEGLDLVGAFVGSEGCFGIAAEIELTLIPESEGVRTLLGIFDSMEQAGRAVTDIMARGLLPAALEIIDSETIRAVEASIFAAGYPTDAGAALVVEVDGVDAALDAEVAIARACCLSAGAREVRIATNAEERLALWRGRKKAFGAMGRLAPDLLVQDATVPRTRLPEVLRQVGEIGRRHGILVANVFHAGDGNLHPNLLFDRRDPDQVKKVEAASKEIMEVCIRAGGTITGEHGVGFDKRAHMPLVCSHEVLRAMARLKEAFDPLGRSNPGKVLPDGYGPRSGAGARGAEVGRGT
ncbi:MAG: FAD-binding protein [Gemmatimonadetes bacterium]|nr:FAD-binding protein [Gemmatimonadota bacterium]